MYFVTELNKKNKRKEIWDAESPLALGYPFEWILEKTEQGVIIRNISGKLGQVNQSSMIQITEEKIDKEEEIVLPLTRKSDRSVQKIKISKIRSLKPAYVSARPTLPQKGQIPQLYSYAGVQRTLISSQPVYSAYVAYVREKPVFSLYSNQTGYTIKPLLNDVQLKLKGQKPINGVPGSSWQLTKEELLKCTMIRGVYWWRFNMVTLAKALPAPEDLELDPDDKKFKKILLTLFGFLFLCGLLITFIGKEEIPPEEKTPQKVVMLKYTSPKPMSAGAAAKAQAQAAAVAKAVAEAKAAAEAQAAAENAAKEAAATKAAAVAAARAAKNESSNAPAKPEPPKQSAFAQKFKNAFGGVAALVGRQSPSTTNGSNGSDSSSNIFSGGSSTTLSKTDVKPISGGTNTKVTGIGGSGGPGGASGPGGPVGYGQGKLGSAGGGGGNSFVSLDSGGSVVDEGLTKEEVGKVIHDHMNEIRYCHDQALIVNPKVEGKISLYFVIGPNGKVNTAKVQQSTSNDSNLDQCILKRLVTWQFPRPKGGINVPVTYPFIFKTIGRE